MEFLAVPAGQHPETLRVTVLGAILICLVLLVLYHVLVAKKAFLPNVNFSMGGPAPAGLTTSSYMTLRGAEQDQLLVGSGKRASFQGSAEPPIFWGSSGESELDNYQHGAEGHSLPVEHLDAASQQEFNQSGFRSGKAGFTDSQLLMKSKGL